jgi:myo-inositol-1(or 4)-monophosphatase
LSHDADLALAQRAARAAGAVIMPYFGTDLVVEHKSPGQPLTQADLAANVVIHDTLLAACPEDGWLSEETRDNPSRLERDRVWIVDPIDGTRSFIRRLPEFTVSIGLSVGGVITAGVVYNPARDEMFYATRGGGAFLDVAGVVTSLRVSARSADDQRIMLASRGEIDAGEFDPFRDRWTIEPAGSTAYKLAWIAWSRGEAFVSRGPKSEWDVSAGTLIVAEAGGRVTDINGAEPRYNRPDPYVHGLIATNGVLHDELLRVITELPTTSRLARRARDPLHPGLDKGGNR